MVSQFKPPINIFLDTDEQPSQPIFRYRKRSKREKDRGEKKQQDDDDDKGVDQWPPAEQSERRRRISSDSVRTQSAQYFRGVGGSRSFSRTDTDVSLL